MCLSKYSNSDLLRQVTINLYSSEDKGKINGLCERELAALINTHYQTKDSQVTISGEKRRNELVVSSINKKIKVINEESVLSVLELLPNEVFVMILKHLRGKDKKNLRKTSLGLYHKTSSLAPMFLGWSFEVCRGAQPDFVVNAGKNFHVIDLFNPRFDPTSNLLTRFPHRISSMQISKEGPLLANLHSYPEKFSHLTSLDLQSVAFSSTSLLVVAPQLEHLKIAGLRNLSIDISTVDEDSKCFTKLKTLTLSGIHIDVQKILTKCCNTLECFKFVPYFSIDNLQYLENDFSSLQYLCIDLNYVASVQPLRNLLSKCSGSLKTLKLIISSTTMDVSHLLEQDLNVTSLEIEFNNHHIRKKGNIEDFLNKCPLVQELTLVGFINKNMNGIVLKNLTYLKLAHCDSESMTSVLEQEFKFSLKTVEMIENSDVFMECKFPVISKLDKIMVHGFNRYEEEDMHHIDKQAIDKIVKMFPIETEVTITEKLEGTTVLRRVYGLQ